MAWILTTLGLVALLSCAWAWWRSLACGTSATLESSGASLPRLLPLSSALPLTSSGTTSGSREQDESPSPGATSTEPCPLSDCPFFRDGRCVGNHAQRRDYVQSHWPGGVTQ